MKTSIGDDRVNNKKTTGDFYYPDNRNTPFISTEPDPETKGPEAGPVLNEENNVRQDTPVSKEKKKSFRSFFTPAPGYFVTPIIIFLNSALFFIMVLTGVDVFQPENESMLRWGANFRLLTLQGEWWRLLTSCFLHFGIFHLLMNMYALLYVGWHLEVRLGRAKFVTAYLLTGIISGLASLWWHDCIISAGASGAIFGMYGIFLSMLATNHPATNSMEPSGRKKMQWSVIIFVFYNLINGIPNEGIDNAAHVGGLMAGLVFGLAFYPALKRLDDKKLERRTIGLLAASVLFTSFIVYYKTPDDIVQYDKKMKLFSSLEIKALEPLNTFEAFHDFNVYMGYENRKKLLTEIKYDGGIKYWKQGIVLLKEADQLQLSDRLHETNRALINYCELRIKSYDFMYKAVHANTSVYDDSIEYYNTRIEALTSNLNNHRQK